jgi:hypothetical protein
MFGFFQMKQFGFEIKTQIMIIESQFDNKEPGGEYKIAHSIPVSPTGQNGQYFVWEEWLLQQNHFL